MAGRHAMRWWPAVYAVAWTMFAVFTGPPELFGWVGTGHVLAAVGALMLAWMAVRPQDRWARLAGTLVAISFPLWRLMSLLWEDVGPLAAPQRLVAMTAWTVIAASLIALYPATWFEGFQITANRDDRAVQ